MKSTRRTVAPYILGGVMAAGGLMFMAAVPSSSPHQVMPSVKLEQPAAATSNISPSASPTKSVIVTNQASPMGSIRKVQAAPLDVTDPVMVPSTTDSSPSPSETTSTPTDSPSPTDAQPSPTDTGTRAPTAPPWTPTWTPSPTGGYTPLPLPTETGHPNF